MNQINTSKILIIDDEEEFAWMLKHMLEALGYSHIVVAIGGKAGLKAFKKEKPGIVFLDINMPDISGFELLNKFKSKKNYFRVKAIVVSGEDYETAIAKSYEKYADYFISKPVNIEILKNVLNYI